MITLVVLLIVATAVALGLGVIAYNHHQALLRARLEHMRQIGELHARHYDALHPTAAPSPLACLVVTRRSQQ